MLPAHPPVPVPVFLPDRIKRKDAKNKIPCSQYEYAASAEEKRRNVGQKLFPYVLPSLEDGSEAFVHIAERLARAGRLAVLVDSGLAMSVAGVSV
jgi:hypothetical protein